MGGPYIRWLLLLALSSLERAECTYHDVELGLQQMENNAEQMLFNYDANQGFLTSHMNLTIDYKYSDGNRGTQVMETESKFDQGEGGVLLSKTTYDVETSGFAAGIKYVNGYKMTVNQNIYTTDIGSLWNQAGEGVGYVTDPYGLYYEAANMSMTGSGSMVMLDETTWMMLSEVTAIIAIPNKPQKTTYIENIRVDFSEEGQTETGDLTLIQGPLGEEAKPSYTVLAKLKSKSPYGVSDGKITGEMTGTMVTAKGDPKLTAKMEGYQWQTNNADNVHLNDKIRVEFLNRAIAFITQTPQGIH